MARLYTFDELMNGTGGGMVEVWYAPDGDEPEWKVIEEIGFCKGNFVLVDGSNGAFEREGYNRVYGMRVWTEMPTDEERVANPWEAANAED